MFHKRPLNRQTDRGLGDGQSGIMGSPGIVQGEGEKLLDEGHPILVRTTPAERDLSVKLLKYFGSKSKSGGGECDVVKVDNQTYCAIFDNEDDRKRVLGRGNHIIEFTVSVTVHDIGRQDVAWIRRLSSDGERMKVLQQLANAQIQPHIIFARQEAEEQDKCPICLCEIEDKVILDKCKHAYCRDCLKRLMDNKPMCAVCGVTYETIRGNQPDGTMRESTRNCSLPGYPGCGTIEINYDIPGGIQTENHPHPGRRFSGTMRTAYLPDNHEGRDILRLLKKAFDQRLIFTVGESRTTGATDTVTWNDIHHKTNQHGGPQGFGYPDPDYLKRVRDELRAKGIERRPESERTLGAGGGQRASAHSGQEAARERKHTRGRRRPESAHSGQEAARERTLGAGGGQRAHTRGRRRPESAHSGQEAARERAHTRGRRRPESAHSGQEAARERTLGAGGGQRAHTRGRRRPESAHSGQEAARERTLGAGGGQRAHTRGRRRPESAHSGQEAARERTLGAGGGQRAHTRGRRRPESAHSGQEAARERTLGAGGGQRAHTRGRRRPESAHSGQEAARERTLGAGGGQRAHTRGRRRPESAHSGQEAARERTLGAGGGQRAHTRGRRRPESAHSGQEAARERTLGAGGGQRAHTRGRRRPESAHSGQEAARERTLGAGDNYRRRAKKSGGGECEIKDTDCRPGYILIHFKDKEAQQRVLQKNSHQLILNDNTQLDLLVFPLKAENAQSMGSSFSSQSKSSDHGATGSWDDTDHQEERNQNSEYRKRRSPSDRGSGDEDPKRHEYDYTRHRGNYSSYVNTNVGGKQDLDHAASGSWTRTEDNRSPSLPYRNSGDEHPKRHEEDPTRPREWIWSKNEENQSPADSVTSRNESGKNSFDRQMSREEPAENRPADPPEIILDVTARLHKKIFTEDLQEEIKVKIPSLIITNSQNFVKATGKFHEIQEMHQYLQRKLELRAEKPSETPSDWSPTDNQEDQVSFSSALYEYIMEIYKTEVDKIERKYKVKIVELSSQKGSTYVRFVPQGSDSSTEKAKESFTDTVQKVMGDWSQEKVDFSVVPMTFSEIKQRVRERWSNILVIQERDTGIILRGPKDELSQAKRILEKGDDKPPRTRRAVTISSTDILTEIPVDARHLDILRKLKNREISDIEQKYNVKMEERRKNGSVLITFRAINATPDLSPHASHSFITLLQKTFFNIEKKVIEVKPEFQDERIGVLQEQLMVEGIDIVMEYSKGTVLLIGHPINVAFVEEKLNGGQNPGASQIAATSGEPMDTGDSSANGQKAEEPDKCPICLCEIEDKVILDKCKHAYCRGCLKRLMDNKPMCAICGVTYGTIRGNQPDGTMRESTRNCHLPGYPGCGTIEINYDIPGGIQTENHPHPGRCFSGTMRTAYLPDNHEGRDILRLLKKAFEQRLIFTVGESRTSGATDTVTWNDIHHKTNQHGGPQGFGYPDPDYLKRVRDELKAKGVE
ncbi:uncharacterized protein ACMZJ9_010181 [Mantella aurantiaca]